MSFDSRLLSTPQLTSPKQWRALSLLRSDPIQLPRLWAEQAGRSFPVRLGGTRVIISHDPSLWSIGSRGPQSPSADAPPKRFIPLRDQELNEVLQRTPTSEVIQAMTRCAAVHAAEHLEGHATSGALHERWGALCLWTSHIALLKIDLKRSSTVHESHERHLAQIQRAWSHFHPEDISAAPSTRHIRATLANLEHLPHLGALGSALGAHVALTAQLYFSLSALGQWFWIWMAQSPELLSDIQYELSAALRETPYAPHLWRQLPKLSSTVLELTRLYPPRWCLSVPIDGGVRLEVLRRAPELSELLHGRRPPTRLLLFPYWYQRDEATWTQAAHFNPRRHSDLLTRDGAASVHLRPFGFVSPLEGEHGALIFHSLLALLTGLLRRGVYQVSESDARELSQASPNLMGGVIYPSGELACRFETSEHVAYVRSSRV